jgi:phospholipid/cholesterol/gamma-HCH transport system substrate-binding protein
MKIKLINQIVGLFIILALMGVAAAVVLLGANQRWFRKNYHFYTYFNSGGGLEPGMSITLKGFEIGKVDAVTFDAANRRARLDFHIFDTYYDNVALENSVIEHAVSPIGIGGGLFYYPGREQEPPQPPLEEGSYITSLDSKEGRELVRRGLVEKEVSDDTIGALLAQVGPLVEDIRGVAFGLQELTLSLQDSIEGDRETQLGELLHSVDSLVSTIDRILSGQDTGPMGAILTNVQDSTDTLSYAIDRTSAEATVLLADLQRLAANLEAITADPTGLVPTLLDPKGSIATFLDDNNELYDQVIKLVTDLAQTVAELEDFARFINTSTPQISVILDETGDVLEGLSNNPLLRRGITEQKEQSAAFNSSRDGEF